MGQFMLRAINRMQAEDNAIEESDDDDTASDGMFLKDNLLEDDPLQMHGYASRPSMTVPKPLAPEQPPMPSEVERAEAVSKESGAKPEAQHLPILPNLPCFKSEPPPIALLGFPPSSAT